MNGWALHWSTNPSEVPATPLREPRSRTEPNAHGLARHREVFSSVDVNSGLVPIDNRDQQATNATNMNLLGIRL